MEITQIVIIMVLSFLAATISGVAGFGGGLILLPLLTYFVSPKVAIPMLTIAQLFGNGSRVFFSYRELRWKPILLFLLGALPLAILGSRMLVSVNVDIVKISIGVFLILVVIYKRWFKDTFQMKDYLLIPGGMLTGFISGLIGSAGPIGAVLFLGLKLPPLAYISSEAFTALAMHFTKIIVYGKYELIDKETVLTGILAGLAMVAGSYAGKTIINRIPKAKMDLVIEILLILSAVQLIIG